MTSIGDPAYDRLPRPDWAGTTTIASRAADLPARVWAETIFHRRSVPLVVKALFVLREVLAFVIRIPRGEPSMLAVDSVVDGEAVIDTDDKHLHFVASVATDPARGLVHCVTLVRFKGWRGRLYFVPVRFLHDPVTRTMMQRASRRLER